MANELVIRTIDWPDRFGSCVKVDILSMIGVKDILRLALGFIFISRLLYINLLLVFAAQ